MEAERKRRLVVALQRYVLNPHPHARLDSFGRKAHARSVRLFGGDLRGVCVDVEAGA